MGQTEYHRIEPQQLDRVYHVFVRLPESYPTSGETAYPTIYLLDGGITYPLFAAYYRYLTLGEEIPEAILVGISYGTGDWQQGNLRSTDFTAASSESEHYGGAPLFQKFLSDELIPLIEQRYRSKANRRVIFGQSIGGQFVLYTALTKPKLFWGHIASNPALHRNLPFFLQDVEAPSKTPEDPRLFVSSASHDDPRFRVPARRWIDHWSGRAPLPWALETVTLEGFGHFSAAPAAFRQGVRWLFSTSE
jgi:predicted alpha/beta superfamily hydrolase